MVSGFWEVQKKSESATKSYVMKIVIEEILPSRPNRFAKIVEAPSEMSQSDYSLMSKFEKQEIESFVDAEIEEEKAII